MLILDDQENIVRKHNFLLAYPTRVIIHTKDHERALQMETRARIERWSRGNFHARLYAFILEYQRITRYVTVPSKLVKNSPFASRAIFPGYSVPCGEYRSDRCTSVEFLVAGGISRNEALYAFAARFSASASTWWRS